MTLRALSQLFAEEIPRAIGARGENRGAARARSALPRGANGRLPATLLEGLARQHALDADWQAVLPTLLRGRCHALRIVEGQIRVGVASPLVATQLRQSAPSLLAALAQRGVQAESLRLAFTTPLPHQKQVPPPTRALSAHARAALHAASAQLPPSPLRDALSRLLARAR